MKNSSIPSTNASNPAKGAAIKNILVPIDFSKLSLQAIPVAKRLAQRFGANIHLAHVQEYSFAPVSFNPIGPVYVSPAVDLEDLRKGAEQEPKKLAREHGLTGTCRAEVGTPFDLICWIARKVSADLIVTSTHGRTGFKRAFLGSTAERLVQHAPCPVFIARESKVKKIARDGAARSGSMASVDSILVPVDFSACSLSGLNYAIDFAKKFSARIIVLNVVDLRPLFGAANYSQYNPALAEEAAIRESEKAMGQFLRAVRFGEVPFQTMIIAGASADAICRVAQSENVTVIITATHGRTGLKHVLIGSTAEVVVRHAECPVLVVPSHPTARAAGLTTPKNPAQGSEKSRPTPRPPAFLPAPTGRAPKSLKQPVPERRLTNKFRESHAPSLG